MYLLRNILSISLFEEEKVLNLILQSISTSAYKDLATKTLEAGTLQVSKIDKILLTIYYVFVCWDK